MTTRRLQADIKRVVENSWRNSSAILICLCFHDMKWTGMERMKLNGRTNEMK